jgi:hypothetical protein
MNEKKLTWYEPNVLGRRNIEHHFTESDYHNQILYLFADEGYNLGDDKVKDENMVKLFKYFFPFDDLILDSRYGILEKGWGCNTKDKFFELVELGVTVEQIVKVARLNKTIDVNKSYHGGN